MATAQEQGKRREQRFDLELPTSLSITSQEGMERLKDLLTQDVCAHGAFLKTEDPLPPGTQVDLQMVIPLDHIPDLQGRKSRLKASGTIIRTQDDGMAVQFDVSYQLLPVLPNLFVYLVGENRLQNEMLSHFLSDSMGLKNTFGDLDHIREQHDPEPKTTYLALLDHQHINNAMSMVELEASVDMDGDQFLMAMYNASRGGNLGHSALKHGLRGLFYLDDSVDTFAKGLVAMTRGELWYSREVLSRGLLNEMGESAPQEEDSLTRKEKEILAKVASGATNKEIADQAFISVHTVKTHLYNIYRKINAQNRLQATLWATKHLEL